MRNLEKTRPSFSAVFLVPVVAASAVVVVAPGRAVRLAAAVAAAEAAAVDVPSELLGRSV